MAVMQDAAEGLVDGDVGGIPILRRDGKGWSWDRAIVQALMRPESVIPIDEELKLSLEGFRS